MPEKEPQMTADSSKDGRHNVDTAEAWSNDDCHRLENDPRFLRRIAKARKSLREGRGVRLEDL
jgi:hypothetical protein